MLTEEDVKYLENMETRILEQSAANMRVILESCVEPKFDLLNEKIDLLAEKVAPKSRVEALEDELGFAKQVIKAMNAEIQELKKAQ